MKCSGCGMEVVDQSERCPYCGSLLANPFANHYAAQNTNSSVQNVRASANGVDIFEKCIRGILEIRTEEGAGSGFLISRNGYSLTNKHVVCDDKTWKPCKKISVNLNGDVIRADIIEMGDFNGTLGYGLDLAVIKLAQMPSGATSLQFEDSSNVRNGETVFAIGNSLGEGTCITSGIVSDRTRRLGGNQYVMTDCAINPGNSGGPLLNTKGNVIGVNTLIKYDADGMKYSIPSNEAVRFVKRYI